MSDASETKEPTTRVEQAEYVVERVRSLGVKISDSSRLMRMVKVLQQGYIPTDDPRFPIALESIQDMYQLRLVVDQMDAHRENAKFRESVRKMLGDAAVPQESGQQTPGRDTQLELYLAAVCLRGGMNPVDYEEPDITCTQEGIKFGIAAKRVKNIDRFEERVKKGIDQIRKSKLPGVVVLDLTLAHNPENEPVTSGIQSQFTPFIQSEKNRQLFARREHDIRRWVAGSGTLAVLALAFTFRVTPDYKGWIHEGLMTWFDTTDGVEPAEQQLEAFRRGFLCGMPHVQDV